MREMTRSSRHAPVVCKQLKCDDFFTEIGAKKSGTFAAAERPNSRASARTLLFADLPERTVSPVHPHAG